MDYQLLKDSVKAVIKQNGNQEITGDLLQATLLTMINSLGSGYQFAGVADGAVVPGTPDSKFFYIAAAPGTYENFGGLVVNNGELAIFFMPEGSGSWYKQSAQISTSGLFFGGVIGTAASPTTDTKMFYVATEPGTYQNFNNLVVNFGEIGVFTKPTGSNVWVKQSIKINPYGFTLYSKTVYASNSLPAKPTDGGKYMILVDNVSDGIKHRYIYTSDPAVNSGNWASMLELQTIALGNDEESAAGNTPSVPSSTKLSDELADISTEMGTKADKVVGATDGNVAELDENGNLKDGGVPVAKIAQRDGYYQSLTAGAAENLIGRGTVNAEFTRRTSGGTADIGTGAANIKKIQGKTIVFNQFVQNGNFADGTTPWGVSNAAISAANNILSCLESAENGYARSGNIALLANHKYYIALSVKCDSNKIQVILRNATTSETYFSHTFAGSGSWERISGVALASNAGSSTIRIRDTRTSDWTNYYVRDVICIDLTQMFGSGSEPTASEFESIFPLDFYNYDAGSLLNLKATSLVTTGFNQWDEIWESGYWDTSDGAAHSGTNWIRSKNAIQCFPSTEYCLHASSNLGSRGAILFYAANGTYLGYVATPADLYFSTGYVFTTPEGCGLIKFYMGKDYQEGSVCLNISWSGVRNGEYEPYEKHTLPLNLTSLTSGGTAIFPDGMKSVGSIFDEVDATKAFKRVGDVDLGTLTWAYSSEYNAFYASLADSVTNLIGKVVCAKYNIANIAITQANPIQDKTLYPHSAYRRIFITDSSYGTDYDAFKTAMSGVKAYYELAVPVEYVLDSTLNLSYYVNDFGTEEITPENGPVPSTAPIIYEVQYAMNAVDTLRNLPKNYISKSSMEHILTALVTAGIIAAYTLTWNATTETYDCTITPIS